MHLCSKLIQLTRLYLDLAWRIAQAGKPSGTGSSTGWYRLLYLGGFLRNLAASSSRKHWTNLYIIRCQRFLPKNVQQLSTLSLLHVGVLTTKSASLHLLSVHSSDMYSSTSKSSKSAGKPATLVLASVSMDFRAMRFWKFGLANNTRLRLECLHPWLGPNGSQQANAALSLPPSQRLLSSCSWKKYVSFCGVGYDLCCRWGLTLPFYPRGFFSDATLSPCFLGLWIFFQSWMHVLFGLQSRVRIADRFLENKS